MSESPDEMALPSEAGERCEVCGSTEAEVEYSLILAKTLCRACYMRLYVAEANA